MTREQIEENCQQLRCDAMTILRESLGMGLLMQSIDTITASREYDTAMWRVRITRHDNVDYMIESHLRATVIEMVYAELDDIKADLKGVQS